MSATERDSIYVGYLPTPKRTAALLRVLVPVTIIGLGLISGLVAGAMTSTGDGVWDLDETTELRGTIRDVGYPVLMVESDGQPLTPVLLVGELKSGVRDQLGEAMNGAEVVIRGNTITRDGLRMLSLAGADAITIERPGSGIERADGQRVELRGEIMDSKCYLGAMKPGQGKTHKACAILCVRGGVPPVLIGPEGAHVLTSDDGALESRWLEFIGEPVVIQGTLGKPLGDQFGFVSVDSVARE